MALTQESVLSVLLSEGGQVKKADLVGAFRGAVVDCADPAEKERNRELFKTLVNTVAYVREVDGVRFVVLRKAFHHLLQGEPGPGTSPEEIRHTGSPDTKGPAEDLSPIQLALQRSKYNTHSVRRTLTFGVQTRSLNDRESRTVMENRASSPETHKPMVESCDEGPDGQRHESGFSSVETSVDVGRSSKTTKDPEEPREARIPSAVPLDQSEHELLVKCAAGHWSHVYGLLLRDKQLAKKKDFMSGFTALHWAAKTGNGDMLVKIIDLSKQEDVQLNVNERTHGGYTPLHIAALHDQQYIMAMLVKEFGADTRIRDNCGKKAYHYLSEGTSHSMREMLGEPKAPPPPPQDSALQESKDELELFPDLSKGLHTISRLLQPTGTGYRKKHKQRPGQRAVSYEQGEEGADDSFRQRAGSDVFM